MRAQMYYLNEAMSIKIVFILIERSESLYISIICGYIFYGSFKFLNTHGVFQQVISNPRSAQSC